MTKLIITLEDVAQISSYGLVRAIGKPTILVPSELHLDSRVMNPARDYIALGQPQGDPCCIFNGVLYQSGKSGPLVFDGMDYDIRKTHFRHMLATSTGEVNERFASSRLYVVTDDDIARAVLDICRTHAKQELTGIFY
jgi:hypothetical protein